MNQSITQWITSLIPMNQIITIMGHVQMAFIGLALMILCVGLIIKLTGSEDVFPPITSIAILTVCAAGSPFLLSLGQQIAGGLVGVIGAANPATNWLVVPNPNNSSLAMDFSKPFAVIGQYVTGQPGAAPAASILELGKWADYVIRILVIAATGLVACFTVFIMEGMLILQKLILVFSAPLTPLFIAFLSVPAVRGSAQNYLKKVVGVMCWPIAWSIGHIGTMAVLSKLQAPSWNAGLGELFLSFILLCGIGLWMVGQTVFGPMLIARTVESGSNFAADMWTGFASAAGQHAAHGIQAGGQVGGAIAGGAIGGPAGALLGGSIGGQVGSFASAPVISATQSAEGVNGGRQALPSSRSAGVADMAIKGIAARS